MLKKTLSLLLLCSCFVSTALAQNHPHTLLWKIEGKGLAHPSYLFGVEHDCDGKVFVKEHPVVQETMDRVTSMVTEIAPGEAGPGLDPTQMYFGGDTTLHQFLSNTEYDTITHFVLEKSPGNDVLIQQVLKMKPQVLHVLLIELLQDTTSQAKPDMDSFLSQYITARGHTIQGLESNSERTTLLMSGINYKKSLQEVLNTIRNVKQGKNSPNTIEARTYHDLNIDYALDKSIANDFGGGAARNANWLKKLPAMMQQQSCFIAVGYDHLRTKAGLIVGLRKLGYKVTPVVI